MRFRFEGEARRARRHGNAFALLTGNERRFPTPRHRRFTEANWFYHVTNRGNDRRHVFDQPEDYQRFLTLLASSREKHPVDVIGHCEMPNHFHLVLYPRTDSALSAYMKRVTGSYACDYRRRTRTLGHGHVFKAPFWSHPITSMEHLLTTLRYVEANPKRAGLVARAQDWPWSSLKARRDGSGSKLLSPLPITLPTYWNELVNLPQHAQVLRRIQEALEPPKGRPKKKR